VEVRETHQRRGIGKALLDELARMACERGITHGWVLTDDDNEAGTALYRAAGGRDPREVIEWEFEYREP
jgi:[ribosomal protein S18]-alanine N-acetyltransferase